MVSFQPTMRGLSAVQMEQKLKQTRLFPNQIAAGSFAPHSTIVEISCFRTERVRDAFVAEDLLPVRQDVQVLCHEMTHWFDFFGTIWGRDYIGSICRAYRAFERRMEEDFPKVIQLFDADRAILSPQYYRFTSAPLLEHTAARPWTIDYVAGAQIGLDGTIREDRPIFMARFGENPSRRQFARQPVSVGALIEVRAIASEMGAAIAAINSHPEDGPKLVEASDANREFSRLAYDHDLIEYNTAAHILSVQAGTKELFLSARLASALAYIALNLSEADFRNLKVPETFAPFGKRNRAFKRLQDRGYAFVAMVFNGGRYDGDDVEYIERCVALSNLGTPSGIIEAAAKELRNPVRFSGGKIITDHFIRESINSARIIEEYSQLPLYCLTLQSLIENLRTVCPPFIDSEMRFIEIDTGRIDVYQPEIMHDASHALREYTQNLIAGCRGV